MRTATYVVQLEPAERQALEAMLKKGRHSARELRRARVLLLADAGKSTKEIQAATGMSDQGILNVKKRYCAEGLQLKDKPRPGQPKKLDSRGEQYLIALACSPAPDGREVWTMQMLADKLIELQVVDSLSDEAVRLRLKKMTSNPGKRSNGASRR